MGKTEQGAVWLNPNMTPPYDLFQYFRNVEDASVEKCLFYFTDLPVDEIRRLSSLKDSAINEAKVVLAYEVTKLIHGESDAVRARDQAKSLFSGSGGNDAPTVEIARASFADGMLAVDVLVVTKICDSKSEARRLIEQGGLSVDDEKITDPKWMLPASKFADGSSVLLRKGKKNFYKLFVR